jgi:hypothetical protein
MLLASLVASNLAALALLVFSVRKNLEHKERRKQRGLFSPWPVQRVPPHAVIPELAPGQLGPPRESEIAFISNYRVPGAISDLETWILCNLAKRARLVFEFGTATGKTTYLFARNAPEEARIVTLTLDPRTAASYQTAAGDEAAARVSALEESIFEQFVYTGSPVQEKVTQLYGDSKTFDETPWLGLCDLVFVDGAHAYSYVQSDSRKALAMVRPGGAVLWHDYSGPRGAHGVYRALNELARDIELHHLAGTSLVFHRRPL